MGAVVFIGSPETWGKTRELTHPGLHACSEANQEPAQTRALIRPTFLAASPKPGRHIGILKAALFERPKRAKGQFRVIRAHANGCEK